MVNKIKMKAHAMSDKGSTIRSIQGSSESNMIKYIKARNLCFYITLYQCTTRIQCHSRLILNLQYLR